MPKHILRRMLLLWMLFSLGVLAQPYFSKAVIFGDSLSDTGNLACFSEQFLPLTISEGGRRASNGRLAVEHLADALGLGNDADPALYLLAPPSCVTPTGVLTAGNNYAVGTATASTISVEHLFGQVVAYLPRTDPAALHVIFIGGNDLILASSQSPLLAHIIVATAVNHIAHSIRLLKWRGARKFMVVLAPDVSRSPEIANDPNPLRATFASALTQKFNRYLRWKLRHLARWGSHITVFDLSRFMGDLLGSGTFSNITDPCLDLDDFPASFSFCGDFSTHFFWDKKHLTAEVHRLLGVELSACFGVGGGTGIYCIDNNEKVDG